MVDRDQCGIDEINLNATVRLSQGSPEDILAYWQVAAVMEDMFQDMVQYLVNEGSESWVSLIDTAEAGPTPDNYPFDGSRADFIKATADIWKDAYSQVTIEDLYPTSAPQDGRRKDLLSPERTEVSAARILSDHPTDVSVPELGRLMGMCRESAQRALDTLESEGMVQETREVCHTIMYGLTAKGHQYVEAHDQENAVR